MNNIKDLLKKCSLKISDLGFLEAGTKFKITRKKSVEKEMEKIYSFVKEAFPSHLQNPILYILGELSDNINQHSQYTKGFIFLNYDKNSKEAWLMIYDNGISIPGGFKKNQIFFSDDSQAIEMAMKGRSTKKEEGRGFGLSTSRKLVEKGFNGNFAVFSGEGIYKDKKLSTKMPERINGTFVYISLIDKGEGLNIYEYLT